MIQAAWLYPYPGRIIRPVDQNEVYGAARDLQGFRHVRTLHDGLHFSRGASDTAGERAVFTAGTVEHPRYRLQTPRYLPDVETADEIVLIIEGDLVAYNITSVAPSALRAGMDGIMPAGGYTIIQARLKAAQTAHEDIYL